MYEPIHFDSDIDKHLDLLVKTVPPIEYFDGTKWQAATLASVLNVGWAALITRLDAMPDASSQEITPKMERLHELLLKGVELSEARRHWEEHKT